MRGSPAQWDSRPTIRRSRSGAAKRPRSPRNTRRSSKPIRRPGQGWQGTSAAFTCLPNGMPRMMSAYEPLEIIITPDITYVLIDHIEHSRHIYRDGRNWPAEIEPTWSDTDRQMDRRGRRRALRYARIEGRGFKGPRAYDASGLPLHEDNATFSERIFLDRHLTASPARRDHRHLTDALDAAVDATKKADRRNPYPQANGASGSAARTIARRDRQRTTRLPERRRPLDARAQDERRRICGISSHRANPEQYVVAFQRGLLSRINVRTRREQTYGRQKGGQPCPGADWGCSL